MYGIGYVYPSLLRPTIFRLNSILAKSTASTTYNHHLKKMAAALEKLNAITEGYMSNIFRYVLEDLHFLLEGVNDVIDLLPYQVPVSLSRFINPFSSSSEFTQRVNSILRGLEGIEGYFDIFADQFRDRQRDRTPRYEYVPPECVVGRRSAKKAVVDLILKSVAAEERVSVVPIVGFFGVGKTTLAHSIYNSEIINAKFDLKLWSSLAKECHNIRPFLEELVRPACRDDDMDTEELKMELHKMLQNKRFLIVLDAFEDNHFHKSLARELIDMGSTSKGSAIIVTTRSRRAAALVGTTPAYHLQPLSFHASYLLFTKMAVKGNPTDPVIEPIARRIAKLCQGVPFFLVKAGKSFWNEITSVDVRTSFLHEDDSIERFMRPNMDHLLPRLEPHLYFPLQSFCLQKACGLSVEALICVWMALGLLCSDDPTQQPEYIARRYLKDILDTPLCPDVEYAPGGVVRRIRFNHALFDCLTSSEIQQWFVQGGKSSQEHDSFTRYIIWNEDHIRGRGFGFEIHVRLFILNIRGQASEELVRDIVSEFKRLHVLGLGGCDIQMLPVSIGQLIHLRYLDVGRNPRIKRLPDSICDLRYLQTLFLNGCSQLEGLPENIGRLKNLRYLALTILEESLQEAIGQLTSLRTLALASCPRLASLPSNLKNLTNLETLGIFNCQVLDLKASSSVEGLMGMCALHTLLLSHLPKFEILPTHLVDRSISIKHLLIQSWPCLTETAWITHFRSLCSLTIEDCPKLPALNLTESTSQRKTLAELVIRRCPSLADTAWIRQFMSLRSLIIDDCPKLVELDAAFSEIKYLERLEVRRCPRLTEWFASPTGKDWCTIVHARVIELDGVHLES